MTINRKICPAGRKNNPNKNLTAVKFVTVHCTGNYSATAGARNHADYVYNGSGGAQISWHYTIDAKEIWQHFEDWQSCWHAGDGTNGPGNSTSIGLEICVNDRTGFKKACENAAWLTAELLKKHNLTVDKVVQHYRWNGKNCPYELRSGVWGVTWNDFISMVKANLAVPEPSTPNTPPEATTPAVGLYRVRKEWSDSSTQKGAFIILNNAKKCADDHHGYSVFDSKGTLVYIGKNTAPPSTPAVINVGTLVAIKPGTKNYYPGGPAIPAWVISDYNHRVAQIIMNGKPVTKGGKTCVLLGKKISKKNGKEDVGINTWVDKDSLTVV